MIGLLLPQRLEYGSGLQLIRVRLVCWRRGRGERQRVEDHRLGVGRLPHHELAHRALVRGDARALIHVLVVVEERRDSIDVAALTLRRARA